MIKFRCQHCNKKIGVQDDYAGKHVWCPQCHLAARVPESGGDSVSLMAAKDRTQYSVFVCRGAREEEPYEEQTLLP